MEWLEFLYFSYHLLLRLGFESMSVELHLKQGTFIQDALPVELPRHRLLQSENPIIKNETVNTIEKAILMGKGWEWHFKEMFYFIWPTRWRSGPRSWSRRTSSWSGRWPSSRRRRRTWGRPSSPQRPRTFPEWNRTKISVQKIFKEIIWEILISLFSKILFALDNCHIGCKSENAQPWNMISFFSFSSFYSFVFLWDQRAPDNCEFSPPLVDGC